MDNLNMEYADASAYKMWIKAGIALLAVGWFIGGLGDMFWKTGMNTIGNFFRLPGGVLLTAGIVIAGMKADNLSNGVRMASIIAGGLLAIWTCAAH